MGLSQPRIAVAGESHAGEVDCSVTKKYTSLARPLRRPARLGINAIGPWRQTPRFHAGRAAHRLSTLESSMGGGDVPRPKDSFRSSTWGWITVNVTLGLPFVRTSPDHGTAFDLAGTGRSDPSSLIQAMRMAQVLISGRAERASGR